MSFIVGAMLLSVVTAVACGLPGVFIVLRRNSMLVDAISHAVLPGIVVGYFFSHSFDSPLLVIGAALAGLVVVLGSEWLSKTGLVTGDAPQGLVFPALFSVGIIMITLNFANVHLDTHQVLAGDLNLASFHQLIVGGISLGPWYMWVMLGVLGINALFIGLFYPWLEVTTFDPEYAETIGIRGATLNVALMFLVAVTVTAAFNAAGAILVVALMIAPPATAYLLTQQLPSMIGLTVIISIGGAIAGFSVAYFLDAATSAGMTVFYGALFLVTFALTGWRRRTVQRRTSLEISEPRRQPA